MLLFAGFYHYSRRRRNKSLKPFVGEMWPVVFDGHEEQSTSEWIWATDIPKQLAGTRLLIKLGHGRWRIENNGFNELVNEWHGDHVYKHKPRALVVFLSLLFLAYNLFHALISLNVKPQLRDRHTKRHFARLMAAEFYYLSAGGFT